MKETHKSTVERRQLSDNTEIIIKAPSFSRIHKNYQNLEERVEKLHLYEPLLLSEFEPEQRYDRCHWIDNLQLPFEFALIKRAYGGVVGNMNFLWKVESTDENHETNMAKVVLKVTEELPKFHTRQMRADFLVKYQRLANTS